MTCLAFSATQVDADRSSGSTARSGERVRPELDLGERQRSGRPCRSGFTPCCCTRRHERSTTERGRLGGCVPARTASWTGTAPGVPAQVDPWAYRTDPVVHAWFLQPRRRGQRTAAPAPRPGCAAAHVTPPVGAAVTTARCVPPERRAGAGRPGRRRHRWVGRGSTRGPRTPPRCPWCASPDRRSAPRRPPPRTGRSARSAIRATSATTPPPRSAKSKTPQPVTTRSARATAAASPPSSAPRAGPVVTRPPKARTASAVPPRRPARVRRSVRLRQRGGRELVGEASGRARRRRPARHRPGPGPR